MTRLKKIVLGSMTAALVVGGAVTQGFALEAGSFDNRLNGGSVGLPLGAAAPPGIYTGIETLYTPSFYGVGNRTAPNSPSIGQGIPLLWSTGWNFLGASYSVALVQAFYAAGGIPAGSNFGNSWLPEVANTIWTPINLSWNLGNGWFISAGFNFMAPDGSQSPTTAFNGGSPQLNPDYWTYEPTLAVAYLANNWAISANFFYDIQGPSKGTCCASAAIAPPGAVPSTVGFTGGNELYVDAAALYSVGKWQFGPVGYAKVQTTNDVPGGGIACVYGPGGTCGHDAAVALGGLVGYNFGPVDLQVWVTDAVYKQDDINGLAVWTRFGFRLWAPEAAKPLVAKN